MIGKWAAKRTQKNLGEDTFVGSPEGFLEQLPTGPLETSRFLTQRQMAAAAKAAPRKAREHDLSR